MTIMVADAGGTVAGALVSLIPGIGWTIAGALAASIAGTLAGQGIKGGIEVKGLIRNKNVIVYSWKYQ
ncbi:hypothetical protein [Staphylococcus americanisciuri]|uniref:Uncharacterized protein n=1 Tax=Staphylococcus americanisciuri TaxID=2973940 RepID=A0ABT2EYH2_9STAP|nr:hypothetical protein [Staphylococcus americanisciuri]MCS4485311.1 hypothetical protein [Staphylococcus americanisciuri]